MKWIEIPSRCQTWKISYIAHNQAIQFKIPFNKRLSSPLFWIFPLPNKAVAVLHNTRAVSVDKPHRDWNAMDKKGIVYAKRLDMEAGRKALD